MEIFGYLIAGFVAVFLWHLFSKRRDARIEASPDIMPAPPLATPPGISYKSRRRRLSGGFYPIGYAGPFLDGEDLVDELLWEAEIAAMTEIERRELGEMGWENYPDEDMQVEDLRESGEFVTDDPAPGLDPSPVVESVPEPAPEAEVFVDLSEPERNTGGWGSDNSDSSGWGSDDSGGGDDD